MEDSALAARMSKEAPSFSGSARSGMPSSPAYPASTQTSSATLEPSAMEKGKNKAAAENALDLSEDDVGKTYWEKFKKEVAKRWKELKDLIREAATPSPQKKVGWWESIWNVIRLSLCFCSLIPLEFFFDWAGEQMSTYYLGSIAGDFLVITLNNAVEATLAIILLMKCELRLLQATIVGVVVLHVLFVPGIAFLLGGVSNATQGLAPHTKLNHSLLAIGYVAFGYLIREAILIRAIRDSVFSIVLPTAFFIALESSLELVATSGSPGDANQILTDSLRAELLRMSRGISIILIIVYIFSRFHIVRINIIPTLREAIKRKMSGDSSRQGGQPTTNPSPAARNMVTGTDNRGSNATSSNEELPKINAGAGIVLLVIAVSIMAVTSEFLVESIEDIRASGEIREEFYGLIVLPFASFAAGGAIAIGSGVKELLTDFVKDEELKRWAPPKLAQARPIDMSIQFTLFWMPVFVLLGWAADKPIHLMFGRYLNPRLSTQGRHTDGLIIVLDYFELALLLGAATLVNYITQEQETDAAKGFILMSFYAMIATSAWFYAGQKIEAIMLACPGSVAQALQSITNGAGMLQLRGVLS
ncbi:hypothetical protein NM688_g2568 [Phlebia brevispora]|uniref:Uncharacterized protein n=1 Tax=Phlebia brevispora TaxID=194682 RepID=A0ACC1T8X2_9APHY|nr:hypothetical protein NM688_g2568 [Phlebia brevispora]